MNESCIEVPLNESSRNQTKEESFNEEKSNDAANSSPSGRSSPEANCPICLGKPQNKSFTDSCLHQFCFTCLLEWSKVKAECPLCKQSFKSIIHNVRSIEDYEQYYLSTAPAEDRYELLGQMYQTSFEPNRPREPFRYRTTVSSYLDYFVRLEEAISMHVLPSIPTQSASTHWQRRRQIGTSDFRRNVYQQGLWVQRTRDFTGRVRDCSPEFYRDNPALLHRLVPWLNRELNVLCNDNDQHVQFVMRRILEQITQVPIRSPRFSAFVAPYLGRHTEHFVHEFYNFASSPYDLIAYDRFANYVGRDSIAHEVSDDDSDVQIVALLTPSSPANSIHLEDSDSDDCVVLEDVLPLPASPEVITLESEADDDVVQVNIHIETDHNRPGPSRRPPLKRNWLKVKKNIQLEKPTNDNVNVSINIAHSSRTRSPSSEDSSSSWDPRASKSSTSKRKTKLTKRRTKSKCKTTGKSKSKAKVPKKVNRDRSSSPVLIPRRRKRSVVIKSSSEDNRDDDSNKLEIITDHYSSTDSSEESHKPRLRSVVFKSTVKSEPSQIYSDVEPQSPTMSGSYWKECSRSYDYKSEVETSSRSSRADLYGPSCSHRRHRYPSTGSSTENKSGSKSKYCKKKSKRNVYM